MGMIFWKSFISSVSLDLGAEVSKVPSEKKKSVYTDEFPKPGKNKKTASTTPSKFCTRRNE